MFHDLIVPTMLGFVIFLFGMKLMELALHKLGNAFLQRAMESFTRTPLRGLLASTGVTAVLQSSTAVTVIAIGMVNTGIIRFSQTLGIILGSNIGTCLTTELIGLNLHRMALPLLFTALIIWLIASLPSFERRQYVSTVQYSAIALLGFACILLGIRWMQAVSPYFQAAGMFTWFMEHAQHSLLWGILAGAVLSALLHSSAVTIALAMTLANTSAIGPALGVAIVLGANVGTCATAIIASIGGSRMGQYVALAHVALNVGGAILFYPFIQPFADLITQISSSPASHLARSQTVFNMATSFLALPLCYLAVWDKLKPPRNDA